VFWLTCRCSSNTCRQRPPEKAAHDPTLLQKGVMIGPVSRASTLSAHQSPRKIDLGIAYRSSRGKHPFIGGISFFSSGRNVTQKVVGLVTSAREYSSRGRMHDVGRRRDNTR